MRLNIYGHVFFSPPIGSSIPYNNMFLYVFNPTDQIQRIIENIIYSILWL